MEYTEDDLLNIINGSSSGSSDKSGCESTEVAAGHEGPSATPSTRTGDANAKRKTDESTDSCIDRPECGRTAEQKINEENLLPIAEKIYDIDRIIDVS